MKTKQKQIKETDEFLVYLDDSLRDPGRNDLFYYMFSRDPKLKGFSEWWMAARKVSMIRKVLKEGRYRGAGVYRFTYDKWHFFKKNTFTWEKIA